jgi:hypothetical protein
LSLEYWGFSLVGRYTLYLPGEDHAVTEGSGKSSGHRIVRVLSHEGWCIAIITVIPCHISAFTRGEMSPLSWKIFFVISAIHGNKDGFNALLNVCVVYVWLLWTHAQMYANWIHPLDIEKVKFVIIINELAGLLRFTPNNPYFKLLQPI